jgi:TatD DNase family protein
MGDQNPELAVQLGAVDTHCHLFLLEQEPLAVVESAKAAGVDRLICVGVDPETSERSLELADSVEGLFATAGMHPHDADRWDAETGARIEELLGDPRMVAVGECGLDFLRMRSPVEDQLRCLNAHIALSNETGKSMVVHVRDAWPEVMRTLEQGSAERVVIHCFSGDADIARECGARGYWISFAGNITYPKNEHLRQAARTIEIDRLLVETDAPFLTPQKLRGHDNEPANVMLVVEEVARVRGADPASIVVATAANARAAFPDMR